MRIERRLFRDARLQKTTHLWKKGGVEANRCMAGINNSFQREKKKKKKKNLMARNKVSLFLHRLFNLY